MARTSMFVATTRKCVLPFPSQSHFAAQFYPDLKTWPFNGKLCLLMADRLMIQINCRYL